ncbi:MAG TPA: methylmalonyl Co-A mutase-associated GTPase MeaB [Panacibacter sp.]|nr:methylmalonyl Co-A mutase-associated GTPase MeaB [Panacibacter sp.]HNP42699.1 methylmalonyl Co-A mutase-associated GTPase MeaB [Panacibacter sp.]
MEEIKTIARNISLIENRIGEYDSILLNTGTEKKAATIVGITGAPGAGKSTIVDGLIAEMVADNKTVAVLCVDPSSPFNMGALLGDRIRMNQWYTNPNVYIRSMASRKELGGLSPMMIEVTEYIKYCGFDYVIVETVGVGQNEVEIAGLADITVLILVPEGGDEIQTMKSGIMEIADIFVVNKSDRPGADLFSRNLHMMFPPTWLKSKGEVPIIKTSAEQKTGLHDLYSAIVEVTRSISVSDKKYWLLADKVYQLIQSARMHDVQKDALFTSLKESFTKDPNFNIFRFAKTFTA